MKSTVVSLKSWFTGKVPQRETAAVELPIETPSPSRSGFSAYGEDILVISWFQHFGIDLRKVSYLDVGAAHPWRINNTFALYQHGARGVLVEPDPDQAAFLTKSRPGDVVLNVGAAFDDGKTAILTRMTSGVFNTFSEEQVNLVLSSSEKWNEDQRQKVRDRIEVSVVPVNEIIDMHLVRSGPDFVSIDAESKDIDILRSFDFGRYQPLMFCMEAVRDRRIADEIFLPHGYVFASATPDNFLYMKDPFGPSWVAKSSEA
jgi:FkbM family methyltransferase